jgi:DNA-binding transcriptional LysR family regulator
MPRDERLGIEYLRTFVTMVDQKGDATSAAKELEINLANLSKRLQVLRAVKRGKRSQPLEKPWIKRDGHTWSTTPDGEQILPVVRDLVRRYDDLMDYSSSRETEQETLWIACGQTIASTLIPDAVAAFHAKHPAVRIRASTPRGAERIRLVSAGLVDLAIVSHDDAEIDKIAKRHGDASLVKEALPLRRFVLAWADKAPQSLREAAMHLGKRAANLKAIPEIPLLLPEPDAGVRMQLESAVMSLTGSSKLTIVLEAGGWGTLADCCAKGMGVALLPMDVVTARKDLDLVHRPIDAALVNGPHKIICNAERLKHAATEAFRRTFLSVGKSPQLR